MLPLRNFLKPQNKLGQTPRILVRLINKRWALNPATISASLKVALSLSKGDKLETTKQFLTFNLIYTTFNFATRTNKLLNRHCLQRTFNGITKRPLIFWFDVCHRRH